MIGSISRSQPDVTAQHAQHWRCPQQGSALPHWRIPTHGPSEVALTDTSASDSGPIQHPIAKKGIYPTEAQKRNEAQALVRSGPTA
jgi:hypothetical protein